MSDHMATMMDQQIEGAICENERLARENKLLRETLQSIADADWRRWEELASPDEFVRWAKSRAAHALTPNQKVSGLGAAQDDH